MAPIDWQATARETALAIKAFDTMDAALVEHGMMPQRTTWNMQPTHVRVAYVRQVRAILADIRDEVPDLDTTLYVRPCRLTTLEQPSKGILTAVWRALIDAVSPPEESKP